MNKLGDERKFINANEKIQHDPGIDVCDGLNESAEFAPYNVASMRQIGVLEAWREYSDLLTWGGGNVLPFLTMVAI